MKLVIESEKPAWRSGETVVIRFIALNDSYEPVTVDRRLLVGPNATYGVGRMPPPIQLEPAFPDEEHNHIVLNPWCFYGRHRTFSGLPVGQVTFHGYLLRRPEASLLPNGPVDRGALLAEAEPLVTTIMDLE